LSHSGFRSAESGNQWHEESQLIILGIILLILGAVFEASILWTIGVILIVVGVVLWLLGAIGRPVYGRRYYY
jgi:hypothetical protein